MDAEMARDFFLWCGIINMGLLLLSVVLCSTMTGFVYRVHGKMFPLSKEAFDIAIYSFLGLYKILIFVFNIVPFAALCIVD